MPELPEVETLVRQLRNVIIGKDIESVDVLRSKSFQGDPTGILHKHITSIDRIGKMMIVHFETKYPKLLVHLKMTGQLIYQLTTHNSQPTIRIVGGHPTADWVNELPSKHTRVIITFTDKTKLFFNDLRVFGWLKLVQSDQELETEKKGFKGLDPLLPSFTGDALRRVVGQSKRQIKIVLLEQHKVAGLGNIYVNDALFLAGIHPLRSANTLSQKEWEDLAQAIQKVLLRGIEVGGSSQKDYVHINGNMGTYQDEFLVYKKDKKICKQCGCVIEKIKLGGRGTYVCPGCQN